MSEFGLFKLEDGERDNFYGCFGFLSLFQAIVTYFITVIEGIEWERYFTPVAYFCFE